MRRLLLIICLFLSSFTVVKAQDNLDKSILWEISGNGLAASSYVLGTFHLVCEEDLHLADKVLAVVESVDQIALEVNLADIDELMSMQSLMMSTVSLSSQLTEKEQIEFRDLLQYKYALDLDVVDHFQPIVLMGMLAMKDVPCPVKGYDMEILNLGLRKNKPILGLEHFKDQIEMTNRIYTAKEILTQLRSEEDGEANFSTMLDAFKQEDIERLYRIATEPASLSEEGKIVLLDNRNRAWVEKMGDLMSRERILFAVGAGHLAGNKGVIQLLKDAGYQVKAVLN